MTRFSAVRICLLFSISSPKVSRLLPRPGRFRSAGTCDHMFTWHVAVSSQCVLLLVRAKASTYAYSSSPFWHSAAMITNAPISPGNSGGPVINRAGEVLGISTFQYTEGQNINFGIPADVVADRFPLSQMSPRFPCCSLVSDR